MTRDFIAFSVGVAVLIIGAGAYMLARDLTTFALVHIDPCKLLVALAFTAGVISMALLRWLDPPNKL